MRILILILLSVAHSQGAEWVEKVADAHKEWVHQWTEGKIRQALQKVQAQTSQLKKTLDLHQHKAGMEGTLEAGRQVLAELGACGLQASPELEALWRASFWEFITCGNLTDVLVAAGHVLDSSVTLVANSTGYLVQFEQGWAECSKLSLWSYVKCISGQAMKVQGLVEAEVHLLEDFVADLAATGQNVTEVIRYCIDGPSSLEVRRLLRRTQLTCGAQSQESAHNAQQLPPEMKAKTLTQLSAPVKKLPLLKVQQTQKLKTL